MPVPRVNDIVRGKRGITADTAVRLEKYFRMPAQFWLNLRNDFDLRHASATADLSRIRSRSAA